jgi:hypothetical protein
MRSGWIVIWKSRVGIGEERDSNIRKYAQVLVYTFAQKPNVVGISPLLFVY